MKKLILVIAFLAIQLGTFNNVIAQNTIKVSIESNDQMKFNLSLIKVKTGQKITLTLKHVGKMPIQAMGHNLVILQKGTDVAQFAKLAALAKTTQYIPTGNKSVIAATKLIGGGQESTITFTAPAKGAYDYICSFPGHYGIMKGKLIVE